jgi:hypothetical protein
MMRAGYGANGGNDWPPKAEKTFSAMRMLFTWM